MLLEAISITDFTVSAVQQCNFIKPSNHTTACSDIKAYSWRAVSRDDRAVNSYQFYSICGHIVINECKLQTALSDTHSVKYIAVVCIYIPY